VCVCLSVCLSVFVCVCVCVRERERDNAFMLFACMHVRQYVHTYVDLSAYERERERAVCECVGARVLKMEQTSIQRGAEQHQHHMALVTGARLYAKDSHESLSLQILLLHHRVQGHLSARGSLTSDLSSCCCMLSNCLDSASFWSLAFDRSNASAGGPCRACR
jgi:hypothetical protein